MPIKRYLNLPLVVTILYVMFGCDQNTKNISGEGKSRKQLLNEIPYRNEIIKDETRVQIKQSIKKMLDQLESLNDISVFYVDHSDNLLQYNGNWSHGVEAIIQADKLWIDLDLIMTLVAYPSYSQNAVTGMTTELWVIEVEHQSVSRTCKMIFETPKPLELTTLKD